MIDRIDHVVLTVEDVEATIGFYRHALVLRAQEADGPTALLGQGWKIDLHPLRDSIGPKVARPAAGSADPCFVTTWAIHRVLTHLTDADVAVGIGPVRRSGALGEMTSVYIRDPDGNLLEITQDLSPSEGC